MTNHLLKIGWLLGALAVAASAHAEEPGAPEISAVEHSIAAASSPEGPGMLAVLAAANDARRQRSDRETRNLADLEQQNAELRASIQESGRDLRFQVMRNAALRSALGGVRDELSRHDRALQRVQREASQASKKLARAQAQRDSTAREISALLEDQQALSVQVALVRDELERPQRDRAPLRAALARLTREEAAASRTLEQAQRQLATHDGELEDAQRAARQAGASRQKATTEHADAIQRAVVQARRQDEISKQLSTISVLGILAVLGAVCLIVGLGFRGTGAQIASLATELSQPHARDPLSAELLRSIAYFSVLSPRLRTIFVRACFADALACIALAASAASYVEETGGLTRAAAGELLAATVLPTSLALAVPLGLLLAVCLVFEAQLGARRNEARQRGLA